MRRIIATFIVAAMLIAAVSCVTARSSSTVEEIDWRGAKPIENVEALGSPAGRVWLGSLEQLKIPGKADTVQLVWYKSRSRDDPYTHIASLHLPGGAIKVHPQVPGIGVSRTAMAGTKLFLGMLAPAHLMEYDPAFDQLKDLGNVFPKASGVHSMAGLPDGSVALGAADSSEVAYYDPRTGKVRQYGSVGRSQAGFLYYISQDANYIYAVPRGNCPWDLISIHKATGAKQTLLTKPPQGYINLSGMGVTATNHFRKPGEPEDKYLLVDGRLVPAGAQNARAHRETSRTDYDVILDKRAAAANGKVKISFRPSGATPATPWLTRELSVGVQSMPVTRATMVGPSQIVGATGPYGPMFLYDISRNSTRVLGYPAAMNVYGIAYANSRLYVSGYPSTQFAVAQLDRAFTHDESSDGVPSVAWSDAKANPRLLASLGEILQGAHTGIGLFPGADGRIYIIAQRHRHHRGFAAAWYDPSSGRFAEIDSGDQFQQLQISWVTPIENGRKLAISTRVQPDDNKSMPPPKEARVFILDTATARIVRQIAPLPGNQALGPIAESGGFLIGTAANPAHDENGPSTLFKVDLLTGQTVQTRVYGGLICGVSANHDAPQKSHDFMTGPDGKIWTMFRIPAADASDLLMRIRPGDLGVETIGTLPGDVRFLFVGNDLYLTGAPTVRRIRNAVARR